ncbi:MAG: hypothetical protein ACE5ED_12680, partial [Rhodothalassiaceae bacterium]
FGDSFNQALDGLLDQLAATVEIMLMEFAQKDTLHVTCRGTARILVTGKAISDGLFGRVGGLPGIPVKPGSAGIIPRQFTGAPTAGPKLRAAAPFISGETDDGQSFSEITEVIGGTVYGKEPVRNSLELQDRFMAANPGFLILELLSGTIDGVTGITLRLPLFFFDEFGCPDGTMVQA